MLVGRHARRCRLSTPERFPFQGSRCHWNSWLRFHQRRPLVGEVTIDTEHPLAWNVVQELGHVLNYVSLEEKLPTVFMPVSPPPYMNGGPRDFLSWVIECKDAGFNPEACAEWLEGRLPRPVNELERWKIADDE